MEEFLLQEMYGLEVATGELVAFVDSDDWIEPDMYEKMLSKLKENDVDVVKCGVFKDFSDKTIEMNFFMSKDTKFNMESSRDEVISLYTTKKTHADLWSLLIKKKYVDKISKFNTNLGMGEDLVFVIELMCVIDSIYIYNERFYHYYNNLASATTSINLVERNIKNLLLLNYEITLILGKYECDNLKILNELAYLCFYKVYVELVLNVPKIKNRKIIEFILQNDKIYDIIKNIDVNCLTIGKKLFVWLINKKCKRTIYCYCFLHNFFVKIVDKSMRQ